MSIKKKQIRANFRNAVFSRDQYKCRVCGSNNKLDAHHITSRNNMPNGGYIVSNGITLCDVHHTQAELGIITARQLYAMIRKD